LRDLHKLSGRRRTITDAEGHELFDDDFLSDLEGLVAESGTAVATAAPGAAALTGSRQALARFLASPAPEAAPLDEASFVRLRPAGVSERCNGLIESFRCSSHREAAQAVESFVVFFQALAPTLSDEHAAVVKTTFFRLVPTLVQMAWDDSNLATGRRNDCREALALLESILLEVSSVKLAPAESELLFKSLDQLASLISAGEYVMARDMVAAPLVGILRKNRVARSLFRLMEVEVAIQVYLKDRLGYLTPQIRLPEDAHALSEFGPIRVLDEVGPDGVERRYLQVQLPDIPMLRDIVVHLSTADGSQFELRLDGLGSVPLDVPPGLYQLGLLYSPEEARGV
jgi:hypothetical protein